MVCARQGCIIGQTDDNSGGLILDGGYACGVGIGIGGTPGGAIGRIVLTGCSVAHAEGCGIFDDDPGIEKAREFDDADNKHQQNRQD